MKMRAGSIILMLVLLVGMCQATEAINVLGQIGRQIVQRAKMDTQILMNALLPKGDTSKGALAVIPQTKARFLTFKLPTTSVKSLNAQPIFSDPNIVLDEYEIVATNDKVQVQKVASQRPGPLLTAYDGPVVGEMWTPSFYSPSLRSIFSLIFLRDSDKPVISQYWEGKHKEIRIYVPPPTSDASADDKESRQGELLKILTWGFDDGCSDKIGGLAYSKETRTYYWFSVIPSSLSSQDEPKVLLNPLAGLREAMRKHEIDIQPHSLWNCRKDLLHIQVYGKTFGDFLPPRYLPPSATLAVSRIENGGTFTYKLYEYQLLRGPNVAQHQIPIWEMLATLEGRLIHLSDNRDQNNALLIGDIWTGYVKYSEKKYDQDDPLWAQVLQSIPLASKYLRKGPQILSTSCEEFGSNAIVENYVQDLTRDNKKIMGNPRFKSTRVVVEAGKLSFAVTLAANADGQTFLIVRRLMDTRCWAIPWVDESGFTTRGFVSL